MMPSKQHHTYIKQQSRHRRRIRDKKKWETIFSECKQYKKVTIIAAPHPDIPLRT
jgi:hypothetical protein